MKKFGLMSLIASAMLFVAFGATTLSAESKCGAAKCGKEKKMMKKDGGKCGKDKRGAGKCGKEKKAAGKCGKEKREAKKSMKCGAGKCG
ncbi:MAG: hypothetical protein ABXS93_06300 [Sulfurimonas sp.]